MTLLSPAFTQDFPLPPADGVGGMDGGGSSAFAGFFVLALLVGLGTLVWKISLARRMARDAGLDPDQATEMVLLSDDALGATYLSSNLPRATAPGSGGEDGGRPRSIQDRLRELTSLLDEGLVTQQEYDARRQAILDEL